MTRRYVRAISSAALVSVLLLAAFAFGREIQAQEFKTDLHQQFCAKTIDEMPQTIPGRLYLDVTDEWNRTLAGETRSSVSSSLGDALAVFSFSERVLPRLDANGDEVTDSDHRMRLVVELGRRLELMRLDGWHCSNHVIVSFTANPQTLTLRFIHELSHFFGLYHEWGDATYLGYSSCLGTHAERFNQEQLEILDDWNFPGSDYTPHWDRVDPGPCPVHQQTAYGVPVLSLIVGIPVALFSILGVLMWRRGKKEQ